jgi:hypothetical protein
VVTSELLYSVFRAIVTAHKTGVSFHHDTNEILDRSNTVQYPTCGWKLPTEGLVRDASVYKDTFTLKMLFVDQTARDRSPTEMMHAHSRMAVIAKHCWIRFHDLYIADTNTFEGEEVDVEVIKEPMLTPVWDDGSTMITGVMLMATVKMGQPECVTTYFN